MVHETWLPISTDPNECGFPKGGGGGAKGGAAPKGDAPKGAAPKGAAPKGGVPLGLIPLCNNRDAATFDTLKRTKDIIEEVYKNRIRSQLTGLNRQLAANATTLVPVWDAVISLRQMTVKGQVPGVAKQTDLFQDGLGHPKKPLRDMASYM